MTEASLALSTIVASLGWTLLHFLWQGALIGAAYAASRRAMRLSSPAARLAAGHLALLACAVAPLLTLALHWPAPAGTFGPAAVQAAAVDAVGGASATAVAGFSFEPFLPWLVAAWASGVIVLAVRTALQWWALRLLVRSARPLDAAWVQRLSALRQRMGVRAAVALRESTRVAAPLLVGWIKPTILLPMGLALRLPCAQLEAVLAHELAHVRRFDTWVNALQCMLETLLFYHPAVHWIGRRVRADREECCDLAVTGSGIDRLDYARALLALGEAQRAHADHGRLAIAANDGVLLARVERLLLDAPPRRAVPASNWPALGLVAVACALLLALPRLAERSWTPVADALWASPSPVRIMPLVELVVGDLDVAQPAALPLIPASPVETAMVDVTAAAAGGLPMSRSPSVDGMVNTSAPVDGAAAAPPETTRPLVDAAPRLGDVLVEPLRPLSQTPPDYPRAALARGIEGAVVVSFRVDASGRPVDLAIESTGSRVFERAALAALARWRFAPGDAGSRHMQTFDFRLDGLAEGGAEREACNAPTGSRICRRIR